MTLESQIDSKKSVLEVLEVSLSQKNERLPKSVRKYIRRLKEAGKWEEAMGFAQEARVKKNDRRNPRSVRVYEVLNHTVRDILVTEDPQKQAEEEIRAVWIMFQGRLLDQNERSNELKAILDSKPPEIQKVLGPKISQIRNEVLRTVPHVI